MKTWLITGCSSGLGRGLALAAAQRGDQVIATARNVGTIEDMAEPFGGRMIALPLDVTDAAAARMVVAKAVEIFGGFDILVNNAGYALFGAIEEGTPQEYRPMFEVNVFGLIETTRAALPVLRRSGGTIVNMSSGAGIEGRGGGGYYHAAKFAVEARTPVCVSDIVEQWMSDARILLPECSIAWDIKAGGALLHVEPGLLRSVLSDLLVFAARKCSGQPLNAGCSSENSRVAFSISCATANNDNRRSGPFDDLLWSSLQNFSARNGGLLEPLTSPSADRVSCRLSFQL